MDGIQAKCLIKEEAIIKEEELDFDEYGLTQTEETNPVLNAKEKNYGKKRRIDLRADPDNERRARNTGRAYISRQGQMVPARSMKNICMESARQPCQLVCAQRLIPEKKRQKIFRYFWNLPDRFQKYEFICRHVRLIKPKKRKPNPSSNKIRNYSRFYFLPICGKLIRVCRTTFTATLDINEQWLSTALKKFGHLSSGLQLDQEVNDLQLKSTDENSTEEFETKFLACEPDPLDIPQNEDPDESETDAFQVETKRKKAIEAGKPYVRCDGTIHPGRSVKKGCDYYCYYNCRAILEDQRQKMFRDFWNIADRFGKYEYLSRLVEQSEPKTKTPSRRRLSRKYFFEINGEFRRVCHLTFTATLDINHAWIRQAVEYAGARVVVSVDDIRDGEEIGPIL